MAAPLKQIDDLMAVLDDSSDQQRQKQKVVICGGGNAAHVFTALAAKDPHNEVHLLSLYATEAADFKAALKGTGDGRLTIKVTQRNEEIKAAPSNVTNDPRCLADSDIVIISLPAFAHNQYLKAIKEHIAPRQKKKTLVAVFPGASGLECDWQSIFGANNDDFTLLSCITLPWACRTLKFGRCAEILGTKHRIEVSLKSTDAANAQYMSSISRIIGASPSIVDFGHILNMSLSAINAIVHPSIMFAKWRNYDGKAVFAQKPLFYQGMDAEAAEIMSTLSDETLRVTQCIEAQTGLALLTQHIYSWYKRCYGEECADTSSLLRTIQTNPGYDGLTHPMKNPAPNVEGFVPDFKYRYLSEDVPFGLVVIRGLSLILDAEHRSQCKCPLMDEIIVWSQNLLGREFLKYDADGSVVAGKDIDKTRAPQRYHIESITELV